MIQKSTILNVSDTCGITKVRCFHVYGKKKHFIGVVGNFVKVSVRRTHSRLNQVFKKKKIKAIFILFKQNFIKPDGSSIKFYKNSCVLLKKRLTPRGKLVSGPTIFNLKRKKFILSFSKCL
jgi:large subunit ribosomal protein L14